MIGINRKNEEIGHRVVREIIREKWHSLFQEFDQQNDEGIDGIIHLRIRNTDTGGIVFVQIKCGESYKRITKKRPDYIAVNLGKKYIDLHRERWNKKDQPVILVYVDPSNKKCPKAFWADLKSDLSYTNDNKNIILIPKIQTFNDHSKGDLLNLTGTKSLKKALQIIDMSRQDVSIFNLSDSIKKQARTYYKNWSISDISERTNPVLGEIIINRIGWRHITRTGRKPERIIQSWLLLSAAKKIITTVDGSYRLGRASKKEYLQYTDDNSGACFKLNDYIGLRAKVNFPHRDSAIVQVVLRRMRVFSEKKPDILFSRTWFYSVYEKRKMF